MSETQSPKSEGSQVDPTMAAFWSLGVDRFAAALSSWACVWAVVEETRSHEATPRLSASAPDLIELVRSGIERAGASVYTDDEEFVATLVGAVSRMVLTPEDPMTTIYDRFLGSVSQ